LERINAERTSAGLSALAWDDSVARVARDISESRREEVLHATKSQVDVAERLKSVELASPVVLLNPAQARTPEEAHRQFSTSPGHRSNYMSPAVSHAGIGVATATDKAGHPMVFVTELFVHELPPVDTEALRQKLRAAMVQKRADARAPAIAKDATLEDVAQKYAKELASAKGTLPKARAEGILAPVNKGFRGVSLIQGAKSDPLEFAEEPTVVSGGKMTGIGIAQGVHPSLGKNAVYVVILMGTRR